MFRKIDDKTYASPQIGVTDIAKAAGITREALYKALRPGSAPRFDTVNRVCAALGVRLVVQPLHPI